MKKIIFYVGGLTVLGCSSTSELKQTGLTTKRLKESFKSNVLCECLMKGYGDNISDQIYSIDKSFSAPIPYILFDSVTNEVLKPIILQMKRDSLETVGRVHESAAGKQVFATCLRFYKSKTLDSIANAESREWRKIKNLDSLVAAKVPAY